MANLSISIVNQQHWFWEKTKHNKKKKILPIDPNVETFF